MFYAVKLAKSGYYGGDPQGVLNAPASVILDILNFEAFESDYEKEYDNLNRGEEEQEI